MEVRGDVEPIKRSVARSYAVHRHYELGLRNIDKKVTLIRVVKVTSQFDGFASESDCFSRFESHVRNQSVGIVHFFQEVGDTVERDDLEALNVLECCRAADVIFVNVGIDENSDWLVRDFGDGCRNTFSESGWRIEYDDSAIGNKKSGLPHVVGDNINSSADILDCIAESWVDLPDFCFYRGQDRDERFFLGR